jgi:glycosyltransferase involved in cell wall biosynthesis/2-polyprenyl-3-methyl-5-hydroxy-6-metoxy-1,4-benzoquinol methylase
VAGDTLIGGGSAMLLRQAMPSTLLLRLFIIDGSLEEPSYSLQKVIRRAFASAQRRWPSAAHEVQMMPNRSAVKRSASPIAGRNEGEEKRDNCSEISNRPNEKLGPNSRNRDAPMTDGAGSPMDTRCVVCGCPTLVAWAQRSDGVAIVRCTKCGMGVIDPIPDDLMALYGDDYYGLGQHKGGSPLRQGYTDYSYTAEHSLGWAAAIVRLLQPTGGRVLDIGCADGHLLAKLDSRYEMFGIEANEATARLATERGVAVLAHDLADPKLIGSYGSFHVITAIAIFEHLRDIRSGMATALHLLRNDGVLLFEVPFMSAVHDNTVWLTSSLEHVWYPSEQSLKQLVQVELGADMIGAELYITGYASTYVGLVFHKEADRRAICDLATRVLLRKTDAASADESIARMLLHLVHAATAAHEDLGALADLPFAMLNPPLLRRVAELWQADLWRLRLARGETDEARARADHLMADLEALSFAQQQLAETQDVLAAQIAETDEARAGIRRLKADFDVLESDRVRSHTELTAALILTQGRLATVQADLAAHITHGVDLDSQRIALTKDRAAADTALAAANTILAAGNAELARVQAMQSGAAWHLMIVLRETARRFPRAARGVRRVARVLWWTVRGRLFSQLRFRQEVRAQIRRESSGPERSLPSSTIALPKEATQPQLAFPLAPEICLEAETGHRPSLLVDSERKGDWPLVSVVITSFNYGQFLVDAVESALAQTFKDLEVIVVEGGSSDAASRIIVAGLQRPRTRVLMQGSGQWAGANRNFGISQARGRYICCLDADDTLAPTYIEKALFLLERHGYDVVSCAVEKVGDDYGQINAMERPDLNALLNDNQMLTCAVFRRSLWKQAGGYRDADRGVSGYVYEDWAFWVRLAALGARFRNLQHDPMLRYRVHSVSLSRSKDVLPISQQREMVRQMNWDVLQPLADKLALSAKQASVRYGTPSAPPASITLNRVKPSPHPPTLLLAMPFLILGGAERLLSAVVAHLVEMGWRVVITTSIDPGTTLGDTTSWFEQYTNEIFQLPRFLSPDLWEDFVHHLVRSRGVDIVWVIGSATAYDCLRGLRAAHPNLRVADLLFNTVGHTENNRRRRDLIDLIFVENNEVYKWLLGRGEDAVRVLLIESGVDLAELRPMARSEALMRRIDATSNDLIVGFSGRWSEEKNPLGFVEIARLVDPALPIRFVMTGTGQLRFAIEHSIREARFPEGRFHLLGEVPEIAPILASFDLLVVPSTLDGRPVVAMEALSLGVPVLASRVGALPEIIQDGATGWLCEPNDHKGFVECIEHAARDRARLQSMRHLAREYAECRLNARGMLIAYETALASLLPKDRHNV